MAFVLADRVREVTTTTGTGAFALGGAPQGYQDFDSRLADGDTTWYTAVLDSQWEMGLGTYDQDTNTLARTQIFQSSEGDAAVNFAAGSKAVFISVPSNALVQLPKLLTVEENADVTDAGNVGSAINGTAQKSTIVNADKVPLLDSEASNALKWGTVSNFHTNLDIRYYSKSEVDILLAAQAASMYKYATVRAATTANITIATALNNGDSLDGVTLATGDYVLVKNQSTASQNGVYVVGAVPARAPEFNAYNELVGSRIGVQEGTTNGDTAWLCTSNSGGTIDVTNVVFTKMNISGELLAANNLSDLTDVAAARAILNVENGADVTDEANVRAALAALTASVIMNRSTAWRAGTVDTQTILQTLAWSSGGNTRWSTVLEADAGYALYAYDAAGNVLGRAMYLNQAGNAIFTGNVGADYLSLLDSVGAGNNYASFFCNTNLSANRSYLWNLPDSVQTYTWPAQDGTIMLAGKQSIPIAAAGCVSPASGGAADLTLTLTNQTYQVKAFDASTAESIYVDIRMPEQWDEGTISAKLGWLHPATTTNFGVAWGVSAVAISNGDTGDVAFGTEVIITDTGGTTSGYYISGETTAVTVAGTPQAGDLVRVRIRRIPTDAGDTMAVDAYLNDFNIYMTNVSGNDA